MPKLDRPLQLSPIFKNKIWGRSDLAPLYPTSWKTRTGRTIPIHYPYPVPAKGELIGEAWLTDENSRILNGPASGMTLGEAGREFGPEICGAGVEDGRFPILTKFLFTSDWLSIQVHPDDEFARRHDPGSPGKCEMWYVLDANPDAAFLLGLKDGATSQDFAAAFDAGRCRSLLKEFHPEAGEAIFVPPGTVHALGPGLVLFEAEQNSDLTYRLDDFGRLGADGKPRSLHRDKGLAVTRASAPALRDLPRVVFRTAYGRRRFVVASRYFAVEELSVERIANFGPAKGKAVGLVVLEGEGRIETADGWMGYRPGDTYIIPPATPGYRLAPEDDATQLLKFYVPDLDQDFRQPLLAQGLSAESIDSILFA